MAAVQWKGSPGVIEARRRTEVLLVMATAALSAQLSPVRVLVATGASCGQTHEPNCNPTTGGEVTRLPTVAMAAGQRCVAALESEMRIGLVGKQSEGESEPPRRVAALASLFELSEMRILMAGAAGLGQGAISDNGGGLSGGVRGRDQRLRAVTALATH